MKLLGRQRVRSCVEAAHWAPGGDRKRVLVEHPDRAGLWAHAEILSEAGYDVATCSGPSAGSLRTPWFGPGSMVLAGTEPPAHEARTVCPFVAEGRCPLVEGADVVVASAGLVDGREIIATHAAVGKAALVVEAAAGVSRPDVDAILVEEPVTEGRLLAAVERALSGRRQRALAG